jgi:hypothetical protein
LRFLRTLTFLACLAFPLSGCFFRTHTVPSHASTAKLESATLRQLVDSINSEAAKIKTLNATVDIATSVGRQQKGKANETKVSEYTEIRGYVLLRKPTTLRMIGLFPVVRNRLFDMVSQGEEFKLSLPTQNKFIVGKSELAHPALHPSLENIRPQHVLDALLVREIPTDDIAVLEPGIESVLDMKTKKMVDQADYVIDVIEHQADGIWTLDRKIHISRVDLHPTRQLLFDKQGNVLTTASYENYNNTNGINFPSIIKIERPQEGYTIQLAMVKLTLNEALKDDQFVLAQPPGSQLMRLDSDQHTAEHKPDAQPTNRLH